jgi:hypothetical protein
VIVVDEQIYSRLPSLQITTVDKFGQMRWNGAVQMLWTAAIERGETPDFYSRPRFPPPVHLCQADPSKTPTAAPKPRKGSIIIGAKSRVRHDVETGIGSIQRRCGVA